MAKKNNGKGKIEAETTVPDLGGFQNVSSRQAKGWLQAAEGGWLVGTMIGRFTMTGQYNTDGSPRAYYQVGIQSVSGLAATSKELGEFVVVKGDIINIDERKAMEDLRSHAETDGVFDIFVHYKGRKDLSGGRSFWETDVKLKVIKPPTHKVVARSEFKPSENPHSAEDYQDDRIPF